MDFLIMIFVKIEQWNSLLKTSKREDINWWVGCYYVTRAWAAKRPQRLTNANSLKSVTTSGKRYGFDNIVGACTSTWTKQIPHMHTKITPVIYDEKKNKIPSSLPRTCSIE